MSKLKTYDKTTTYTSEINKIITFIKNGMDSSDNK